MGDTFIHHHHLLMTHSWDLNVEYANALQVIQRQWLILILLTCLTKDPSDKIGDRYTGAIVIVVPPEKFRIVCVDVCDGASDNKAPFTHSRFLSTVPLRFATICKIVVYRGVPWSFVVEP